MTLINFLFYLFSFVLISSALIVVLARNTIYSVLFLILAFFNAAAIFIMLNAEFIAMLLIVVYVGAIAVLFLFVVMMLNVDKISLQQRIKPFLPILLFVSIIFFGELVLAIKLSTISNYKISISNPINYNLTNTQMLGNVLYTDFIVPFQIVGAILFVAMIGAILLTLRQRNKQIKQQNIFQQISRDPKNSIEMVKIKSGSGFEI